MRTPTQLGLLERFHQTLKTEEVYWKLYASPGEARESLEVFRRFRDSTARTSVAALLRLWRSNSGYRRRFLRCARPGWLFRACAGWGRGCGACWI